MRKVIDMQMKIGELGIGDIEFDLRSRDEIPELLMGLQSIYCNREIRARVFEVLMDNPSPGKNFQERFHLTVSTPYPKVLWLIVRKASYPSWVHHERMFP